MSVLAQQPCFAPLEGPWEGENCGSGAVHPNMCASDTKTHWKALQSLSSVFSLYPFKCQCLCACFFFLSLCHLDRAFGAENGFLRGRLDSFFPRIPCVLSILLKNSQLLFHSARLLGCSFRALKPAGTRKPRKVSHLAVSPGGRSDFKGVIIHADSPCLSLFLKSDSVLSVRRPRSDQRQTPWTVLFKRRLRDYAWTGVWMQIRSMRWLAILRSMRSGMTLLTCV